jgi:hypothetical protein
MPRFKNFVFSALAILAGASLILWTFRSRQLTQPSSSDTSQENISIETSSPSKDSTPFSLLEEASLSLQASLSGLLTRVEELEEDQPPAPAPTPAPAVGTSVPATITFQPQILYLGSASTRNRNWTNSGVEMTINSFDYPTNVSVVFEAGLSIEGGEAWARLINQTTGAIINTTEIFHNNKNLTWKSSPAFKLHQGTNTYAVELRSTSGETANMSGARLQLK